MRKLRQKKDYSKYIKMDIPRRVSCNNNFSCQRENPTEIHCEPMDVYGEQLMSNKQVLV